MKKVMVLALALLLAVAFSVPAFAASVSTGVNVDNTGVAPIVKAKWETPDADPSTPGTQIMPAPGVVDCPDLDIGTVPVTFWAVVDLRGNNCNFVTGVYADVYHPDVVKQVNLTGAIDPSGEWCGSHKYQVELLIYPNCDPINNEMQVGIFTSAVTAGLIVPTALGINPATGLPYTFTDIEEQLRQGEAELYMGVDYLCDHQPAGCYTVDVVAQSAGGTSAKVTNCLTFLELTSFLLDFTGVQYGSAINPVIVDIEKQVSGDALMCGTPDKPTVWNNGNTYLNLTITQNDAKFGQRTVGGVNIWNVHWCARLGNESFTKVCYDPNQPPVTIPTLLVMCNPAKLDFFILVDKIPTPIPAGGFVGTMTIGAVKVPFMPCP